MELQDYNFTMNYREQQRQIILCMDLLFKNKKQKLKKNVENFC